MKNIVLWFILFFLVGAMFLVIVAKDCKIDNLEKNIQTPEKILIKSAETIEMNATGYALGFPYNSITKYSQPVMNKGFLRIGDVEVFTVSADPNIFPLGSVIYIDSLGIGLVHDTGTKIIGRRLDICFQTMDQAKQFGKKKVKVILLRKGDLK